MEFEFKRFDKVLGQEPADYHDERDRTVKRIGKATDKNQNSSYPKIKREHLWETVFARTLLGQSHTLKEFQEEHETKYHSLRNPVATGIPRIGGNQGGFISEMGVKE